MSQQQKQQVVDPNVNPPPTEQELLEYRVTVERLTSTFRENVQVHDQGAYAKLIHDLKVTVSKFHKDLVEADEWKVMQSISSATNSSPDGETRQTNHGRRREIQTDERSQGTEGQEESTKARTGSSREDNTDLQL